MYQQKYHQNAQSDSGTQHKKAQNRLSTQLNFKQKIKEEEMIKTMIYNESNQKKSLVQLMATMQTEVDFKQFEQEILTRPNLEEDTKKKLKIHINNKRDPIISFYEQFFFNNNVVIGRGTTGTTIQLRNSSISKNHLAVTCKDNQFYMKDLGSKFGSFQKIRGESLVQEDDEFKMNFTPYLLHVNKISDKGAYVIVSLCIFDAASEEQLSKPVEYTLYKNKNNEQPTKKIKIGSEKGCEVPINDDLVHKKQAQMYLNSNNKLVIVDTSDWVGVLKKLKKDEVILIQNGDIVQMGYTFQYENDGGLYAQQIFFEIEELEVQLQQFDESSYYNLCELCFSMNGNQLLNPCRHLVCQNCIKEIYQGNPVGAFCEKCHDVVTNTENISFQ